VRHPGNRYESSTRKSTSEIPIAPNSSSSILLSYHQVLFEITL
jgi:hypothetical protein